MTHKITGKNIIEILKKDGIFKEASQGFSSLEFSSVCYNSKEITPEALFVCKGINFKESYLQDALLRGATAYMSEKEYGNDCDFVLTTNIRRALALVAKKYFGYDPGDITLFGVTGTKGKSTTIYYLVNILDECLKEKCAYLTTVDIFDGKEYYEATLTTPESLKAYEYFDKAKQNGVKNIVMELSSQSDKMDRLVGMEFEYGIFVNISDDHIAPDEHKDFNEYFTCKKNIVARYKNAVINLDDERSGEVIEAAKNAKKILTYSLDETSGADIYAKNIIKDGFKTRFTVVTPAWQEDMEIIIPGVFNVSNALAGISIAYMMGLDPRCVKEGVNKTHVEGRMNIFEKNGYITIVDYAHNKDSIHHALTAIKEYYPTRKIKILFGCPGCKAFQRRMDMSVESVHAGAYVYISSEDPSYKDPMEIAKEVEKNILSLGGKCEIETDRKRAVIKAIQELKDDEILLIAGKGSEHYQVINGVAEAYDGDTVLAKEYMEKLK